MSDTPEATARKATEKNALDLNALALLGTITAPGGRAALILVDYAARARALAPLRRVRR